MSQPMIAALVLAMTAPVTQPSLGLNHAPVETRRLHVGNTGINCVRLPCPSRGIFEPDERGFAVRNRLLHVDLDGKTPLPPIIGSKANRSEIIKAWESRHCLAIEGQLIPGEDDRPVLRVDRIIGSCGHDEG